MELEQNLPNMVLKYFITVFGLIKHDDRCLIQIQVKINLFSCPPGVGPGGAGAGGVLGGGAGRGDEFWMMRSNIFPVNTDSFFYFSGIFC